MKDFRAALETGRPQLGCFITYPAPGAVERMAPDWDWFWIDGQHGELGYNDVLSLVRACDLVGRASMVRVPSHEAGWMARALDAGATGVIVPQVNGADEARAVVRAAKFPPLGERSFGGRRVVDLRGRGYSDTANRDTLLMVQLESPGALENLDEIAATPGVDVLCPGPDDVMLRRGRSMAEPYPKDAVAHDLEALVEACKEHGKFSAAIGIGAEMMELCVSLGANLIVGGSDVGFLAAGSKKASEEARGIIQHGSKD